MKQWIVLAILAMAVIGLAYNYGFFQNGQKTYVCFNEGCFKVTIVSTPYERSRGLMQVSRLDDDEGMLFVFESEGVYPFWMKDVLIPLDIIWMDSDGAVAFIARGAQPCSDSCQSIGPGVVARYVLEVNAGAVDRLGLVLGEKAKIA